MPKVSTRQQQYGQTLILNFTIARKNDDTEEVTVEPIIVNDFALVKFKFQHVVVNSLNYSRSYLLVSKIFYKKIAKNKSLLSQLQIKVSCEKLEKEWDCTDDWAERELIRKGNDLTVNDTLFSTLEVKITLHETKIPKKQTQKLYEDEELIDFYLSSADGKVGIHKSLLAMTSDVFMMMLKREWKETLEGQIGIVGVTKQTLQALKQYIYLGTLPEDGLDSLLVIAERYMMYELKADCIAKMTQTMNIEKLDNFIEFACLNNVPDLIRAILFQTPPQIVAGLYELENNKKLAKDKDGDKENSN